MGLLNEVILQAWTSLITHRFRAGLTMLGIAWGIVTVVLLMAYGNGFHSALEHGFRNAFSNGTLRIANGQTSLQAGGERAGRRIFLKDGDVEALNELGILKRVSPEYLEALQISYGQKATNTGVRGVSPEYGVMRSEAAEVGRFINAEDVQNHRRVAFLGSEVARKLFGGAPAVGQTVRIANVPFEVIGVLPSKAQISNYFYPDRMSVFIPWTTVRQVWSQDFVDFAIVQTLNPAVHDRAVRQIREVLAARHRFDPRDERAVRIDDSSQIMEMLNGITNGLQVILGFIGTLTLMIGGVGVMNIMLVSVTERTREIGIRKALGARRRHILVQFLLEALAITFFGGVAGVVLSSLIVWLIPVQPFLGQLLEDPSGATDIHLVLSPDIMLATAAILGVAGVISGFWPAMRASRLDPIESLRYE